VDGKSLKLVLQYLGTFVGTWMLQEFWFSILVNCCQTTTGYENQQN